MWLGAKDEARGYLVKLWFRILYDQAHLEKKIKAEPSTRWLTN
jgi:hypothetical protein